MGRISALGFMRMCAERTAIPLVLRPTHDLFKRRHSLAVAKSRRMEALGGLLRLLPQTS